MSALDRRFAALADPTRRAILARLALGEATVRELGPVAPISQPALSRHLKVLEAAGLIETRIDAQRRPRRLRPEAVAEARDWLARVQRVFEESYRRLDDLLSEMPEPSPDQKD